MQYTGEYTENVHSYVNNINTTEGGTHLSGFRTALTRTLNNYGKKENMFKDLVPTGDDFREGLTAVIAVRVPDPQFEGQTKTKLGNSEVEGIVNSIVGEYLAQVPRRESQDRQGDRQEGRCSPPKPAKRPARPSELVRERKGVLGGGGLPGKLRDCSSRDVDKCELYLVEGDSAGGTAEGGRLREYQAILPLRGKIINAYKIARRQGAGQRRSPQHDRGHRHRHRRRRRPHEAALQQDRHHDRCRRRRLAHPHAAAHLLLSPDVRARRKGPRLRRPAAAVPRAAARRKPTTCRPKRR